MAQTAEQKRFDSSQNSRSCNRYSVIYSERHRLSRLRHVRPSGSTFDFRPQRSWMGNQRRNSRQKGSEIYLIQLKMAHCQYQRQHHYNTMASRRKYQSGVKSDFEKCPIGSRFQSRKQQQKYPHWKCNFPQSPFQKTCRKWRFDLSGHVRYSHQKSDPWTVHRRSGGLFPVRQSQYAVQFILRWKIRYLLCIWRPAGTLKILLSQSQTQ